VLSLSKRQNTPLNYSRHNITHPHFIHNKFWDSYFLKNCFACSLTRHERTRPLHSHLISEWRCSCCESILPHSVLNSLEFKSRLLTSLTIFTTFFNTFWKSVSIFFAHKPFRLNMQTLTTLLCELLLFIFGTTPSHYTKYFG